MGPGIFSNLQVAYSFEEEYLDPTYIDGLRRHHLSQLIVEMSSQDMENGHTRALPKQVRPVDATGFAFLSIVRSELSTFFTFIFPTETIGWQVFFGSWYAYISTLTTTMSYSCIQHVC